MKHTYEKPVITVDAGMAEGVYAASGATNYSDLSIIADWNGNSGQAKFTLNLNSLKDSQSEVVVSFNTNISNGWGGGASTSHSGSQLTLSWYSTPGTAEIFVQVDGSDIKNLAITDVTYSKK